MSDDVRHAADRRLADAAASAAIADPRPGLRGRLRELRARAPLAFDRARLHYDEHVLPRLGEESAEPPLETWIGYGRFLGELDGPGRTVAIEENGRAHEYRPPYRPRTLVLHLPDDAAITAFVIAEPAEPSPAQQAAMALLVAGRLAL
jgi:hypothetical protein